jgi:ribose transport system substrate-binding protein
MPARTSGARRQTGLAQLDHKPRYILVFFLILLCCATPASARKFLIGFAQDTLANDWRVAQVEDVRRELSKHPNIKFVVKDAEGSTALQIMQIEDLVASGIDVLITSPRDQKSLTPSISHAYRSGIPVILLSRGIQGDTYTAFVRPDNLAIGRAAGKVILEALNNKGTVLMLVGVHGASTSLQRTQGFMEVVDPHPEIRVIRKVANYLRADAIFAVESMLAAGETFDAIYAQSDSMAAGARLALMRAGIDPGSVPIVGIDYIAEARQAIRQGHQVASFTYDTGGKEGAQLAVDLLLGKPIPKAVVLESIKVTTDNVDQVEPIF